jgi:deazaflavin-dependent oxidoreductase (nitroreductase family)
MTPALAQARRGFKRFNPFVVWLWRLGLGSWVNAWPQVGGRIRVLTHTGRKTGTRRRTPVNYTLSNGDVYCVAGFGPVTDWYRNVRAQPRVEVWLPEGWWAGEAEEVADPGARLTLLRQVLIASGFAAYAAGLDPVGMADDELAAATQSYRLLRIRRNEARTGPGGPGDLAWVWPAATMGLIGAWLLRRSMRAQPGRVRKGPGE